MLTHIWGTPWYTNMAMFSVPVLSNHTSQSIRHYLHSTHQWPEPIAHNAYTHMGAPWYTNMAMFSVPDLSNPHFPIHQTLFAQYTSVTWANSTPCLHTYGGLHDVPIWLCSLFLSCLAHTSQSIRHYLHSTHQWPEPIAHNAYTHMGAPWYTNMAMFFVLGLSSPHFPIHQTLFTQYTSVTWANSTPCLHTYGGSMIYQYGYVLCPWSV